MNGVAVPRVLCLFCALPLLAVCVLEHLDLKHSRLIRTKGDPSIAMCFLRNQEATAQMPTETVS